MKYLLDCNKAETSIIIMISYAQCQILLLFDYLLIQIQTGNDFSSVHFVLTQNLPLPNRLRAGRRTNLEGPKVLRTPSETPMEDPYGKSQERPKVIRKSFVVFPNFCCTKNLREGSTFELLLWHTTGRSTAACGSIGVFS